MTANPFEIWRGKRREDELTVRFRNGRSLALRSGGSDLHIFLRVFLRDEYRLRGGGPWRTVLDLGGNVGCFSHRVAREAERLIVYEPDPANLAQLRKNLADEKNVAIVARAVAGEPGMRKLHVAASGQLGGRATLYADLANPDDGTVEVEVTTLDAVFDDHAIEHCDLLKIDIEGAEYEALGRASPATLAGIDRIVGEYHDVRPEDPDTRIDAFERFLERAGFRVEVVPSRRHANQGLFFAKR